MPFRQTKQAAKTRTTATTSKTRKDYKEKGKTSMTTADRDRPKAADDIEEMIYRTQTSQSSASASASDDGITAALVHKLQSGLEKKMRDKETKCLAAYEKELNEIQTRHRMEVNKCCDEIDQIYESFLLEYAKMEDQIRALWVRVAKTFQPYMEQIQEQLTAEEQLEKSREKEQMLGLALHKKANDDYRRLISALMEEVGMREV